jgi:DNA-binding Lrp family transcriptional regulator
MVSACVLIICELGCEIAAMDEITTLSQVTEVNRVYGSSYDMMIKISADTTDQLNYIISSKIRRIEKVRATQTMMVIESQGKI